MLISALISVLVGVLLSRSKVLILIPVFFVTLLIAIGVSAFNSEVALSAAGTAIVTIIGLQVGYLIGMLLRHQVERARDNRRLGSTSVTR